MPLTYVLITPARNEADYIELTIRSMISQTVLPLKWVIVSDGSTDGTDDIVRKYLPDHPWMELVRAPERKERDFAGKVMAFNIGFDKIKHLNFDIIGSLDADLSFDNNYFGFLLEKFLKNSKLGVAGTPFIEDESQHYNYSYTNIEHVSGACQLFRRRCFEDIGGYTPIKGGGIDWTAVTTARMKGWDTRTYTEKTIFHHRKMGTGRGNYLSARFRQGKEDYYIGNHPLWELFRTIYQMKFKPYIIGGLLLCLGYTTAFITGVKRPIPIELVEFQRREQMERLKKFLPIFNRK
jgi:glycosyltransferase involved in cell wall biosynthesis